MPRTLSDTAKQSIHAQITSEAFFILVTIDHADLGAPLRFVNNNEDVVSRSQTYLKCAFLVNLPTSKENELPEVQIQICNVDRAIAAQIRTLTSAPSLTLELVLASDPDTVEAGPFNLTLAQGEYDEFIVSGTLRYEDILDEPFPSGSFDPPNFPALF